MAAERNISIYKGDTYTHEARIKNASNVAINISNRTYTAQIRKSKASQDIVENFTVNVTDAANGVLVFSLVASVTSNIQVGTYYYDLQEQNSGVVTTLMGGKVIISGEVTRG
jgi:hypothetical protein